MAANFKKVLFEGSNIDVRAITASNLQELTVNTPGVTSLPILSYDDPATGGTGLFRQIAQDSLNQAVGSTLFTVSGSDGTSNTNFNAASHKLVITTSNPSYVGAALTSTSDTTTITFTPIVGYITGSGQLNIISGSVTDFNNDNLGGDWDTTIQPISGAIAANKSASNGPSDINNGFASNYRIVSQDNAYAGWQSGQGLTGWRATANLWANESTDEGDTHVPNPNLISTAGTNVGIYGRRSVFWLSASLLGGFSDGTPSTSASFSTITGSIFSISSSISTLGISASALNDFTGSDNGGAALTANIGGLALSESLISKTVESIEENGDVDQISFLGTDELGNELDQGVRLRLGTPTTDTDISAVDSDAHDLTILGTFTADSFGLGQGLEFQQVNISRINGGINFGTSSLHTHRFFGDTDITGSAVVTGGLFWGGQNTHNPPIIPGAHNNTADGVPFQVLVANDNGEFGYAFVSGSGNLAAVITGSANAVSNSFNADIATVQSTIGDAADEANTIDELEEGFTTNADSLQTLYGIGIKFTTGDGTPDGVVTLPKHTASFVGTETEGTDILTTSFASNAIRYTIHPTRFANAALQDADGNIYTSSVAISASAASLNIYVEDTDGVLTGSDAASATNFVDSFTDADLLYIQDLADDLSGAPADAQFITGAGDFSDLTNFTGVNQFNSPSQGVAEFSLQGTYKFGATGSKMGPGNDPQFTNLTIDDGAGGGDLRVLGTLTRVNNSNLLVKDQFVLLNSGALKADGQNASGNDKDGGIIIGAGDLSGSMLMYDFSHRSWGFIGSLEADNIGNEVESSELNTLSPEATVRVIKHSAGAPPSNIDDILYGVSTEQSQKGIMYVDTSDDAVEGENIYIYA